jgi:large subunit ribosomal protein L23
MVTTRAKRLPTVFPNFDLRLLPLSKEATESFEKTGWVRAAAFRTKPHMTKQEIRGILEGVYGLDVKKVNTINYEGKKKPSRSGYFRRPDWKKAHVIFNPPSP